MNRHVIRARYNARVQLWAIASGHLSYPPLELNAWFLPEVRRWEPYYPPFTRNNFERRHLVGRPIVPSLVLFMVRYDMHLSADKATDLRVHLEHRTGSRWAIRRDMVDGPWLPVERIVDTIVVPNDDGSGASRFDVHALPTSQPSLLREIVGGLFGGRWERAGRDLERVDADQ